MLSRLISRAARTAARDGVVRDRDSLIRSVELLIVRYNDWISRSLWCSASTASEEYGTLYETMDLIIANLRERVKEMQALGICICLYEGPSWHTPGDCEFLIAEDALSTLLTLTKDTCLHPPGFH